ncbi:hypothetical protein AAKU55_002872 [Oxalobacteraceae bacterium GrIS 1.11]
MLKILRAGWKAAMVFCFGVQSGDVRATAAPPQVDLERRASNSPMRGGDRRSGGKLPDHQHGG